MGGGLLPFEVLSKYTKDEVFIIPLKEADVDTSLLAGYKFEIISFVKVGKIMSLMKSLKIKDVCFAGKVKKPIFSTLRPDITGLILLFKLLKLKNKGDDNVIKVIVNFIEQKGFYIKSAIEASPMLEMKKGVLTKSSPNNSENESIKLGLDLLNTISSFDVGQACVLQEGVVIGIEGVEGTDELIKRCSLIKYKSKNTPILIKSPKKDQSLKIDIPVIGFETILNLKESGFRGIAIKAEGSIFLELEKAIDFANQNNIFIVGI